jgi:HD superfamily phosphodiesterase
MSEELFEKAGIFAEALYKCVPGHTSKELLSHVSLVFEYGITLARTTGANETVVGLAAILHDIGKVRGDENHALSSAELSASFIRRLPLEFKEKILIIKSIRSHSNRLSQEDDEPEVKIIQSADALSRLFEPGWEQVDWSKVPKEYIEKNYKKFNAKLTFEPAKKIAEDRMKQLKSYLD